MSEQAVDPRRSLDPVNVLALDVGTTAVKAVCFAPSGDALALASTSYSLLSAEPGAAELDPTIVRAGVRTALLDCLRQLPPGAITSIGALSLSAAMHGVVLLDADGSPLTALYTWADSRGAAVSDALVGTEQGRVLAARTGTPIHPMSPLIKLAWIDRRDRDRLRRAVFIAGVKELVLLDLCGTFLVDESLASGTGLFDLRRRVYDDEALGFAGVRPEQLAPVTAIGDSSLRLRTEVAHGLGLRVDLPVVIGAADGPLANVGAQALLPGHVACSLGTSAALRGVVAAPIDAGVDGLFCYLLEPGRYVVGGATNNAGSAIDWARTVLAGPSGPTLEPEALLGLAARAPVGSSGLLALTYLLGERSVRFDPHATGAFVGLRRDHGVEHLSRAIVEGICQQLGRIAESMARSGIACEQVALTGGLAANPLVRQVLADVLGRPNVVPVDRQGSAFGAALVAWRSLGLLEDLVLLGDERTPGDTVTPIPDNVGRYAGLRRLHGELDVLLAPTMRALEGFSDAQPHR